MLSEQYVPPRRAPAAYRGGCRDLLRSGEFLVFSFAGLSSEIRKNLRALVFWQARVTYSADRSLRSRLGKQLELSRDRQEAVSASHKPKVNSRKGRSLSRNGWRIDTDRGRHADEPQVDECPLVWRRLSGPHGM